MTYADMNTRLDLIAATFAAILQPEPTPLTVEPRAVLGTACDAAAIDAGYTRRVLIDGGEMGGEFLIQPGADLDDRYRAWGVDWQEWTWVNGWNVLVEEVA